ncbi:MAG: 1-deoxy-D-xylulose-5-phosphate synthase, partial [Mailhella sp.]|nr:1-deoxy-D-xylulose-5-phosphate synthase [Mailhella sp.]
MTDFNIPASLLDENLPHSIRQMDLAEKERLARDIRQTIIQVVAKNGGHLAPSLGVVELTLALLSVFNPSRDHIIWDVGHQCYPW